MRRPLLAVLSLLAVSGVEVVDAQTPARPPSPSPSAPAAGAVEVRGKVLEDKSDNPVARASVSLRAKGSTSILTGAIASPDGSFRLQGLRPGVYSLRATFIGFAPSVQEITIESSATVITIPPIRIARVAVELSAVSVQAERATVAIEPDRTAYRAKDVAPAAANASEILDAIPSVQVDADGKVSLRGNENVAVQINGRPTPMRGAQLAAFLKSLPANTVERIEVVPNPSAKYDPDGMAGIINVVMKQNVDLGLSVGLNAAISQEDRYNASGNVGYQAGRVTSFATLGFNRDTRAIVGVNDRERYDALRQLQAVTAEEIDNEARSGGVNFTGNVEYKLSARDVVTNAVTLNRRSSRDRSSNAFAELDGAGAMVDSYFRPKRGEVEGSMVDYTLALRRVFDARKHELSGEVRFNRADDREDQTLWRESVGETPSRVEGEHDLTDAVTKQLTGQIDYMRTVAPRTKLETGYKGNARWLDRTFTVHEDELGTGTWTISESSNAFTFDETVHAVYGLVSHGAGKFDMQAGLRGEHAERDFALAATSGGRSYPYRYNSLFPSGVVTYNATQATQLKASYSRRIRRPGTQELNPFVQYFDVQNVFIGNPALAPEYTDAFELGVTRNGAKGLLQLSPFYRRTSNIIRVDINTTDTIGGREVTSVSFINMARSNSWGADLNGSLRLGPRFNGFAGVNVFKMVTDGGSTSSLGSDAVTWSARVNGTTELSKTLVFQASAFYRAPMPIERGRFERMLFTNFSIRKKLDGDNASVTLRVTDPFKTGTFRVRAGDDKVMQITERNFGSRMVWLAFQYNHGRPPRVRQPRQEQDAPAAPFLPPP